VLLLGFGIFAGYAHNVRLLRLVRRGHVAEARFGNIVIDASSFASLSFEVDGRTYEVRQRPSGTGRDETDKHVLYDPRIPARNTLCDGTLASIVLDGRHPAPASAVFDLIVPLLSLSAIAVLWLWA
jgi:hypothetical protein